MRGLIFLLLTLLLSLPAGFSARAAAPHVTTSLLADRESVGPQGAVTLALRMQVAPGWHIYWRNPGDAGVAPDLAFSLPSGASAGPIAWPAPQRIAEDSITTYAHIGDVLLTVPVTALPSARLPVTLHASWLVCANICVPEEGSFHLDLPAGAGGPSTEAALFQAAAARLPRVAPWDAKIDRAGVLHVLGADLGPRTVADAWFAADAPDIVPASDPQSLTVSEGRISLALLHPVSGGLSGVLTLRDPGGQTSAYALRAVPGEVAAAPHISVARIIGFALLGGLILNVMPCVFPVLAMKAAGLAQLHAMQRGAARLEGLGYLAGVVATFCVVGATLLLLRQAGELVGWGFQLQNPPFVAAMALVLFLVGLNLSGLFEVSFAFQGAGQSLARRGGLAGSFATGALAVLVATPCTVPFMGAAVTAALATPGWLSLGIFAALGVGLALPYVLVAWVPWLRAALPRPGPWMVRARQVLALPMYATVLWLGWVLARQTGAVGAVALAGGCAALTLAFWQAGRAPRAFRGWRPVMLGVAIAFAVVGSAAFLHPLSPPADGRSFSVDRLADLRRAGKPVFVDMSAAWCVTCLVNERLALDPPTVQTEFSRRGVTLLRGDWTRRDADITRFLREHGSDGVPLYVLYPGGNRAPLVLPSVLTPGIVLQALEAVG